jgi:hypothetical protein
MVPQIVDSGTEVPASPKLRFIDHFDPRLVNIITAAGFGVPIAVYFWVIYHYSVNVIRADQLNELPVIKASYSHFPWEALWTEYQNNRMFFPRLIAVVLAHTVNFNIQVEEYLSAIMLLATVGVIIVAHKARAPRTPWLYYCPVVLLAFSLVQAADTLWGFQVAWYLILLSLAIALALLDRPQLSWIVFAGAIAAGIIGSYSAVHGLLIWPTGIVLLYQRRRNWPFYVAWIMAAAITTAVYFHNGRALPYPGYARHHPWASFKFFVYALGSIVGRPSSAHADPLVMAFGVLILLLAIVTLVAYGFRSDETSASPIGVALIVFGLLFAAALTEGRAIFGYPGAASSLYTVCDLLVPIGIYLALLGRPRLQLMKSDVGIRGARWTVAMIIGVQVVVGLPEGISRARFTHFIDAQAVQTATHLSNSSVANILVLSGLESLPSLRQQVQIEEELHLSSFHGR